MRRNTYTGPAGLGVPRASDRGTNLPMVTPVVFPIDLESDVDGPSSHVMDSSADSFAPTTPQDHESLDRLWHDVWKSKERILAASPPKIKSLEAGPSNSRVLLSDAAAAPKQPKVKKRKSLVDLTESPDGRMITAVFDFSAGVKKEDIHVSYQATRLVVTWRTVKVTEHHEGDVLVRDREEHHYHRTIPLPEGTKFSEVRASKDPRHLTLTYPKSRAVKYDTPQTSFSI